MPPLDSKSQSFVYAHHLLVPLRKFGPAPLEPSSSLFSLISFRGDL